MTPHLEAKKEEISKLVILSGDPLRAKYIADNYLTDVKLVNQVRGMFYFTGKYNKTLVTVGGHGMGNPSIGIYAHELFNIYDVECILRLGTAGSYNSKIKLRDLFNVKTSYSSGKGNFLQVMLQDNTINEINADADLVKLIDETAKDNNIFLHKGKSYAGDVFYDPDPNLWKTLRDEHKCDVVEMETAALFSVAKVANKKAACLLTISDSFYNNIKLSSQERQTQLNKMILLGLKTIERLDQKK